MTGFQPYGQGEVRVTRLTVCCIYFLDMRKIFCRRYFFPVFLLSLATTMFLAFTAISQNKQDHIISLMYNCQSQCNDSGKVPSASLSSVPPNYLVVPYREFVLRTTISCRTFKLDNPKKDLARLHPKHSSYLAGNFSYVVPFTNITMNDVETFYTEILPKKKNDHRALRTSFAVNIAFDNIPYKFHDGLWHPIGVVSAQRTAILVSLQNRTYNTNAFLLNMHAFARRQQLTYTIILVEQVTTSSFLIARTLSDAIGGDTPSRNEDCLLEGFPG